jgi:glycosyltransferase involved in cell wall biosynthesis
MNVANGYWLPLLRLRGIPTVVNVDGIEWEREKWGPGARILFRGGAWFTARFASELIFDAREIGRIWTERFGRDGHFIPYGADSAPELPLEEGLTHRGYILMVARLVPENTVPAFLEAAAKLATSYDVVIVGSTGFGGDLDRRVSKLAEANNRVRWFGQISDDARLCSLWQHCGVYFHGHSVGGTNPSLVQAMACGAPIVARDTPYNREVLGSGGRYCQPNPRSISDAISQVMDARNEGITKLLKARAREQYDWASVCASYERILSQHADGDRTQARDGRLEQRLEAAGKVDFHDRKGFRTKRFRIRVPRTLLSKRALSRKGNIGLESVR